MMHKDNVMSFLSEIQGWGYLSYSADEKEELIDVGKDLLKILKCDEKAFRQMTSNTFRGMIFSHDKNYIKTLTVADDTGAVDQNHIRVADFNGDIHILDLWRRITMRDDGAIIECIFLDITERVQYTEDIYMQAEMFRILTAMSGDSVYEQNCITGKVNMYGDFAKRFGKELSSKEFLFHPCKKECHYEWDSLDVKSKEFQLHEDEFDQIDRIIVNERGEKIWSRWQMVTIRDVKGVPVRIIGRVLDTNDFKESEERYRQMASYDDLTSIQNRRGVRDQIRQYLETEGRNEEYLLAMIDVDDFKVANDKYGHPYGDQVLRHISQKMEYTFFQKGYYGRLGGDEFIIFLRDTKDEKEKFIHQLQEFSRTLFDDFDLAEETDIKLSVSVGVVYGKHNEETINELYSKADVALYKSKIEGKNKLHCYNDCEDLKDLSEHKENPLILPGVPTLRNSLEKIGVCYGEGLQRFMNNEDMYRKYLKRFIEDENFQNMETALDDGDCDYAFRFAHTLKGTAANLSLTPLYDKLVPLVEALREKDVATGKKLRKDVRKAYIKVVKALEESVL